MAKRTKINLAEEERKKVWAWRQLRKKKMEEEKNKPKKETPDLEDILKRSVEIAMDEMCPTYKKWEEHMDKCADSAWFAISELERIERHMDEVHGGKTDECGEGCLEDFTLEDGKEYVSTIMKEVEKHFKD